MAEPQGAARGTKLWWWVGSAILLLYVGWIVGPYVRSALVRDAAVTTWIQVATSPIYGHVDTELPTLGQRVGEDGVLLRVHNDRVDRTSIEEATAEVARADATVAELTSRVEALEQLDQERQAGTQRYADALVRSLAIEAEGAQRELGYIAERLALIRAAADRKQALARRGSTAQSEVDEAMAEVAALELQRVEREKVIAHARLRQAEASSGLYLAADGNDPDWAYRSRDPIRLELTRTRGLLAEADAALSKAKLTATAEQEQVDRLADGIVAAPAGSVVWSMIVGAGAAVDAGTPVAQWIDCDVMLLDVPTSDVEIALIGQGMAAEVILEGETRVREGTVLLTRGSAATLGSADLAAIAKGRTGPGVAQAILAIAHTAEDAAACPIGRAAYVRFPKVGLLEVVRARLRI